MLQTFHYDSKKKYQLVENAELCSGAGDKSDVADALQGRSPDQEFYDS